MTSNHHNHQPCLKIPEILVDYREKPSALPDLLVKAGLKVNSLKKLSNLVELRHGYRPKKLISRKLYVIQGLPNVGPLIAKRLLGHFKSVQSIMTATEKQLAQVKGIGQKKARLIKNVVE